MGHEHRTQRIADIRRRWEKVGIRAEYGTLADKDNVFWLLSELADADNTIRQQRKALAEALPWIGVNEDRRGLWCPPEIRERVAALVGGGTEPDEEQQ